MERGSLMRPDGRNGNNNLRNITITPDHLVYAEGSALIKVGNTHVICSATIEDGVPFHLKGSGTGWVTAEYSMLPRATHQRKRRERGNLLSGRTQEIQRLIGRSLRSVVNLSALGEKTITVDCDVIQADGGTRTASITGAFVAVALALRKMKYRLNMKGQIIYNYLASTSVGMLENEAVLDLCYEEDFQADVDMNIVMTDSGRIVEIQGTGEETTFSKEELTAMVELADTGIKQLIEIQREFIPALP